MPINENMVQEIVQEVMAKMQIADIRLQFPVRSICITLYGTFIIREYVKLI